MIAKTDTKNLAERNLHMSKTPFVTKEQLEEIVKTYPTPFHIYDEKGIRENAKALKDFILEASETARLKRRTLNVLDVGADAAELEADE